MILIITEELDKVSDNLIDWLIGYSKSYTRLTYPCSISLDKIAISNTGAFAKLGTTGTSLNIDDVKSVWYRRATLNIMPNQIDLTDKIKDEVIAFLKAEQNIIVQGLESVLKEQTNYIGSYAQSTSVNKINNLLLAKKVNFSIPDTLITTKKSELLLFKHQHTKVITKNIDEGITINSSTFNVETDYTSVLEDTDIESLNDQFPMSLFQECVEKTLEIRVFLIENKLFPMAIFSQRDEQTAIDYRRYNRKAPNRNVPISLPAHVSQKILAFAKLGKISTGSFDLILKPNNEFVFLEINPVGEFHWLSEECNYYIEREIAKILQS